MTALERKALEKRAKELGVEKPEDLNDVQLRDAVEAAERENFDEESLDGQPADLTQAAIDQPEKPAKTDESVSPKRSTQNSSDRY